MHLLKEHVESVEKFTSVAKVELKTDTIFKHVKIDIQQAKVVGKIRQRDYREVLLSDFMVLSNKNEDVEKSKSFAAKIRQAEGSAEIVTTFRKLTVNGSLTAQYDGLGTQLGICHTQGKYKTDIQSLKTEVDEEFQEDVKVPAKTEYNACVIKEFILYECDLENVRLSTKKSLEISCRVTLSNGDTKKRSYKLQDVLRGCRVREASSDGDYVYELKGKYRWTLMQRRIKTVVIP